MSMAKYGDQSRGFTYDAFLSFRGEDMPHNIISHLRDALRKRESKFVSLSLSVLFFSNLHITVFFYAVVQRNNQITKHTYEHF